MLKCLLRGLEFSQDDIASANLAQAEPGGLFPDTRDTGQQAACKDLVSGQAAPLQEIGA